jgi:hypothetical protein
VLNKFISSFVELFLVALFVGYLLYRYPEAIEPFIPWIALVILWQMTWKHVLNLDSVKKFAANARRKWCNRFMAWILVFCAGGVISVGYWWLSKATLGELARIEAEKERDKQLPVSLSQLQKDMPKIAPESGATSSSGTTAPATRAAEGHHPPISKSAEAAKPTQPSPENPAPTPAVAEKPDIGMMLIYPKEPALVFLNLIIPLTKIDCSANIVA